MKFRDIVGLLVLWSSSIVAEENRIQQTDSFRNNQYQKPSYTVQDNGKEIETDPVGNKQYDRQQ